MSLIETESTRRNDSSITTNNNYVDYHHEDVEVSYHNSTEIHVHHTETVSYDAKLTTSTVTDKQELSHEGRSKTPKKKRKKAPMIDADQPPSLDRPSSVPTKTTDVCRPKNFLVRVYRNGDSTRFAYCASCTMDIILSEATRKLDLIRPAQRLFNDKGCEIFRSEDIQRNIEYYVSCGENFISPSEVIGSRNEYASHSRWTINGIETWYQRNRRQQEYIRSILVPKLLNHEDGLTQTLEMKTRNDMGRDCSPIQGPLTLPLLSRPSRTANFHIKVYRNSEKDRLAYCESCKMDILLSSVTQNSTNAHSSTTFIKAN